MQGPTATPKSGKPQAIDKRPEHLRLVEKSVSTKYGPERKAETYRKPDVAEEAEDLWDNVPI